jgi:hypothetical protein
VQIKATDNPDIDTLLGRLPTQSIGTR